GALGTAATIVVEVVGHGALDGVGTVVARRQARSEPLLVCPPGSRRALRLREVENVLLVGVLHVISQPELLLVIDAILVAPARNPGAAGRAAAVAEMQTLLEHAPVWFRAGRKAKARAAGDESGVADGARHGISCCLFCLLFVYYPFPECAGRQRTP